MYVTRIGTLGKPSLFTISLPFPFVLPYRPIYSILYSFRSVAFTACEKIDYAKYKKKDFFRNTLQTFAIKHGAIERDLESLVKSIPRGSLIWIALFGANSSNNHEHTTSICSPFDIFDTRSTIEDPWITNKKLSQ